MKHEIIKKTILYRITALLIGFIIPFLITGDFIAGFQIGLFTEIATMLNYYVFEKLWRKIKNET